MHKFHYYNIRRIRFFPSTILIINVSGLIPKGLCLPLEITNLSTFFDQNLDTVILRILLVLLGWSTVPTWQFLFSSFLWFNSTNSSVPLSLWHILSAKAKQDEGNWICLYAHVISCILLFSWDHTYSPQKYIRKNKISTNDQCVTKRKIDCNQRGSLRMELVFGVTVTHITVNIKLFSLRVGLSGPFK